MWCTYNISTTTMIRTVQKIASDVYRSLGPGYSEQVYHKAMEVGLRANHIRYETERVVPVTYDGHVVGNVRADLIIDNRYVIELKSVKTLNPCMHQQTMNYLKLTGIKDGLLINFPNYQADDCQIQQVSIAVPLPSPATLS